MIEVSLNKIRKNYGFKNVLNELSFEAKTGERIALIGENGCGKTTILKIIAGIETIDDGQVSIRKDANIGFLTQLPTHSNGAVKDILYNGLQKELEIMDRLKAYETKMMEVTGVELDRTINSYTKLQEVFINMGGYELETRIAKITESLNIGKEMLTRSMNELSGGERTLVNLAAILLSEPDILLLDEPTNHLDIQRLEWLEGYLNKYRGTVIVVSHDRYFLDKVTTKTVLIEREAAEIFNGNYSYYLEENENRIMLEFKNFTNQQKQIEAMKATIKKLREWGKNGDNEKFFKRANSIEKRLEKIEMLDKPIRKKEIPLVFDINNRSGVNVIKITGLDMSFGDNILLSSADLDIKYKDKICIIGKNGSGKSTLIKKILDNNDEHIIIGSNVNIGYVPQELKFDNEELTVLEEARNSYDGLEQHLRSSLYRFLFNDETVFKKLKYLSGGEKVRLRLFCLIQKNCNLLILDEPTNHIDITTKEILEEALLEYKGTVLFISHDRYFINKVADSVVNIENKKLISYVGNYDYFREKRSF